MSSSEHSDPPKLEEGATSDKAGSDLASAVAPGEYGKTLARHGRIDLDPMPSDSPNDPLNWSSWRKNALLWIVAFHAMQGPFSASIPIPGFILITEEFSVDINTAAYLVSVPIVFLGTFPLIWSPISSRIGRRPVYLISALVSAATCLAGGFCNSYGTLMLTRVFQAIFICPPLSLTACTVQEMFFSHQKGQKMGVWLLMVTVGPPLAPLVVGYLVQRQGWRSAQYLTAAIHLALFFAHLFLGPETIFPNRQLPGQVSNDKAALQPKAWWHQYVRFGIYDHTPIRLIEFIRPFAMAKRLVVLLPTITYSLVFTYTTVLMTIFVPELFGEEFHLDPGPIGLQFISLLIGAVLGEQLAGLGSDYYMNWRTKRAGERVPEFRLPLVYPGILLSIVGLIVWGVQLQNATIGQWNVTPDVGSAIAIFGSQIVATVCTTYAVESYKTEAADIGAFVTFVRQLWAFIAPFYLGRAFVRMGQAKAAGLFSAITGIGFFLIILLQIYGAKWRGARQ